MQKYSSAPDRISEKMDCLPCLASAAKDIIFCPQFKVEANADKSDSQPILAKIKQIVLGSHYYNVNCRLLILAQFSAAKLWYLVSKLIINERVEAC